MKSKISLLFLCMALLVAPAMPMDAAQPIPQVGESPLAGSDGGGLPDVQPTQETCGVDLASLLAAQQRAIGLQEESLATLRSCNTLLLSLALFELFRSARGMSGRVFRKRVPNG